MKNRRYLMKRVLPVLCLLLLVVVLLRHEIIGASAILNIFNVIYFDGNEDRHLSSKGVRKLLRDSSKFLLGNNQSKIPCGLIPDGLQGKLSLELTPLTYGSLDEKFDRVLMNGSGGHWMPKTCKARHRLAIIVPYRSRDLQLRIFLNHMHGYLQKQLINYAIYIIEEEEGIPFNRALLMNIGFVEALKDYDWDCFVFHDVGSKHFNFSLQI
jgi:hypothetical protein